MSAEEKKDPENGGPYSTERASLSSGLRTDHEPPQNQATDPTNQEGNLLARLKKFIKDPRVWLELAALAVLVFYTVFAGQQSRTMSNTLDEIRKQTPSITRSSDAAVSAAQTAKDALESATRPYVGIALNLPVATSEIPPFNPSVGQRLTIQISYVDYGRLPTNAAIRSVVAFSTTRLNSGPDLRKVPEHRKWIWPPPFWNVEDVTTVAPLTDAQFNAISKGGWLYLRVEVLYDSHTTRFCKEYPVVKGKLARFQLCRDPTSNYAN
jgi:hypothetical protein